MFAKLARTQSGEREIILERLVVSQEESRKSSQIHGETNDEWERQTGAACAQDSIASRHILNIW